MQGKKNYQEKLFIKFQLSDHVPADNIYRRLNELIDFNFLYKSTAKYYGREGQKSIDPVVFMKLMLAGYLENINSDRRIINALRLRLDIRYFIGYDLDEELPWHSTLSRTRQLYGEHIFMELFKKVLEQCIDKGMVSGRRQAIDSVFIKANASNDSMLRKGIIADAVVYSKELQANEADTEAGNDPGNKANDNDRSNGPVADKALSLSYTNQDTGSVQKARHKVSNETHYSPVDTDARLSMKKGKPLVLNYLGQVCVDTATHMITYVQAFTADKRDSQCLPGVLANMVSNLTDNDITVQEVVADTNYSSGTALKALEAMGITGYISNIGGYKTERGDFIYHPENDYYECKNGQALTLQGIYDGDKRYTRTQMQCNGCPFKATCIGDKREIALTETVDKPYYDRMHLRMQTKKAKRLKIIRQSTVEPAIGTLVDYLGIKKVRSRGLAQANKCLTMAAVAYNLKKMLKYKPAPFRQTQKTTGNSANEGITVIEYIITGFAQLILKTINSYRILNLPIEPTLMN
jgi:transposase